MWGMATAPARRRRILFVDDEEDVLQALRDLLRRMRASWEMVFANSGQAALAELDKGPFDVVISDMRMPGMDGAELLARVRERHPGTARIILSGYSDPAALLRAGPAAHQVLTKPCEVDRLKGAIEQACAVRRLLEDPALRELVGSLEQLPASPAVLRRLGDAIESGRATQLELARIVEMDAALTARLLQLANSSLDERARPIVTAEQAVARLGTERLRSFIVSAHAFVALAGGGQQAMVERQQVDAALAARIVRRYLGDPREAELAFSAALVHDVGQMVMGLAFPRQCAELFREAREGKREFAALEREHIGVTHAQIGGYLLGTWGLPAAIVDAVALHQEPAMFPGANARVIAALHVAAAHVEAWLEGMPLSQSRLAAPFLAEAGVTAELAGWRAIAEQELAAADRPAQVLSSPGMAKPPVQHAAAEPRRITG